MGSNTFFTQKHIQKKLYTDCRKIIHKKGCIEKEEEEECFSKFQEPEEDFIDKEKIESIMLSERDSCDVRVYKDNNILKIHKNKYSKQIYDDDEKRFYLERFKGIVASIKSANSHGKFMTAPEIISAKLKKKPILNFPNLNVITNSEILHIKDYQGLFGEKNQDLIIVYHGGGFFNPEKINNEYYLKEFEKLDLNQSESYLNGVFNNKVLTLFNYKDIDNVLKDLKKRSHFGFVITENLFDKINDYNLISNPLYKSIILKEGKINKYMKKFSENGTIENINLDFLLSKDCVMPITIEENIIKSYDPNKDYVALSKVY